MNPRPKNDCLLQSAGSFAGAQIISVFLGLVPSMQRDGSALEDLLPLKRMVHDSLQRA